MSSEKGLLTATDWMAYYEKLFRDDTLINMSPLSLGKDDSAEQAGDKQRDSSKN
jgi:hypothetical protein